MAERNEKTNAQSKADRYPYRHHGPTVHGSKIVDFLISEASLREDYPELFQPKEGQDD